MFSLTATDVSGLSGSCDPGGDCEQRFQLDLHFVTHIDSEGVQVSVQDSMDRFCKSSPTGTLSGTFHFELHVECRDGVVGCSAPATSTSLTVKVTTESICNRHVVEVHSDMEESVGELPPSELSGLGVGYTAGEDVFFNLVRFASVGAVKLGLRCSDKVAVCCLLFAVCCLLFAVCCLLHTGLV